MLRTLARREWVRSHASARVTRLLENYDQFLAQRSGQGARGSAPESGWSWGSLGAPLPPSAGAGTREGVYANSAVNMDDIDVVGFDFDYTLIHYTEELNRFIFDRALARLAESRFYPAEILEARYDPTLAVRGLSVDRRTGAICKLSYRHNVNPLRVYLGRQRLTPGEALDLFDATTHVSVQARDAYFRPVHDQFALSEAALLATVLDAFLRHRIPHDTQAVVEDITACIRDVHVQGELHRAVLADPDKYVDASPRRKQRLRRALEGLRAAGKKLFISTNSPYGYLAGAVQHVIGEDWQSLFDVVIASAQKPDFYATSRPFRRIDTAQSPGEGLVGGRVTWEPVDELRAGEVYVDGSLPELARLTGWSGPSVLYFGDSLWADLVEARRHHGWTTGAVLAEVEQDIAVQSTPEYRDLALRAISLKTLLRLVQRALIVEGRDHRTAENAALVAGIEEELQAAGLAMSDLSHERWGSIFRTENHSSLFAFSLQRYVDLYCARIDDLCDVSPSHRFYPSEKSTNVAGMAHDVEVLPESVIEAALLAGVDDMSR